MNALLRTCRRGGPLLLAAVAFHACSDGPSAPPQPAALQVSGTIPGTAVVGSVVTPAVRVADAQGNPVAGTTVAFAVTDGGGTIENASAASNSDGIASPGAWTFGTGAGTNRLLISFGSLTPVTIAVTTTAGTAARLDPVSAVDQSAATGTAVADPPSVRAEDQFGNPVSGATVTFINTVGGGTVTGGTTTTNATGEATVGSWVLGSQGDNALVATVSGVANTTFTATGVGEAALTIEKFAGDATTCPVDRDGCVFSVRVLLPNGQPVSGEAVTWSNGSGPDINTVTNLRGIATAGNIAPNSTTGARTQAATLVSSGASAVFNYTLVPDAGYNIVIRYIGNTPNASVQAAFEQARLRWESIITGNLPSVNMVVADSVSVCGIEDLGLNEVVDDLLILAVIDSIDGPGGTLGSAGPCYIRSSSALPVVGLVRLDTADLAVLDNNGLMEDVILHEIGHTLGFPALWGPSFANLLVADSTNPYYTGLRAGRDFVVAGGTLINSVGVP
ncbi:MAG: hypothetical protein KFH98_16330, partial [Gemmatimonadetes bacterium]|nr:hypothetical protein [Gemmatimonadota bacterium]